MRLRRATCGALALLAAVASAQTTARPNLKAAVPPTLRVFLDCTATVTCDSAYVRTAINYVSYVRDPSVADVHVLLTAEPTGSGGQVTTGQFIGRAALAGLVRFAARTGLANDLSVSFSPTTSSASIIRRPDPWHAWVFGLGLGGSFAGQ